MTPLVFLILIFIAAATISIWIVRRRLKSKRFISAIYFSMQALTIVAIVLFAVLVFSNLYIYNRLTDEREVAELDIFWVSDQRYRVALREINTESTSANSIEYQLDGDEWQLDARIIKWKGWANLIGMDSLFLLERLSGRYSDISQANQSLHTAHSLIVNEPGINLWKLKKRLQSRLPLLDAYYGQSVFVPMIDKANYKVSIGQSGLLVRPGNEIAKQALADW